MFGPPSVPAPTGAGAGTGHGFADFSSALQDATRRRRRPRPRRAVRPRRAGRRGRRALPRHAVPLGRQRPRRLRLLRAGPVRRTSSSAWTCPRVADQQARAGSPVARADARPGDLVFFGSPVDHVGIYAGNGQMVVAPHTGDVVKLQSVDLSKAVAIRRVVPAPAAAARRSAPAATPWPGCRPPASRTPRRSRGGPRRRHPPGAARRGRLVGVRLRPRGHVTGRRRRPRAAHAPHRSRSRRRPARPGPGPRAAARRYLAQQLKTFGGRADLAVAAYNAGPAAVRKHGGIPPYPETEAYVKKVMARYNALGGTS